MAKPGKTKTPGAKRGAGRKLLSIIVPVFNEAETLPEFHRRLVAVVDALAYDIEILYVDDGSSDTSRDLICTLREADGRVALVGLSRNFGKEAAMTAGLDNSRGDAIVVIDADLQDPPEIIPQLVEPWARGEGDVVYAQRRSRAGETWFKRASAHAFYRVMERVGRAPMPRNVGDFRLLSRRAVDDLNRLREQHRFMKGLFAWIGYRQIPVAYDRDPRFAGTSKWSFFKLWNFSIEGITSFTTAPLKIVTYVGLAVAVFAVIFGLSIIYKTLVYGGGVPGYPSLMVVVLFLGGVQLTTIGILGEYVGRISDESKHRPLYLIQDHLPAVPVSPEIKSPKIKSPKNERAKPTRAR